MHEYVVSLKVKDIRVIDTLHHDDIDMPEETILYEMIKLCINTLNSENITPD